VALSAADVAETLEKIPFLHCPVKRPSLIQVASRHEHAAATVSYSGACWQKQAKHLLLLVMVLGLLLHGRPTWPLLVMQST
jgi:hypothetical protein